MSIRKMKINNTVYNVLNQNEYREDIHERKYTAIESEDGYVYPVLSKTDYQTGTAVGAYPIGNIAIMKNVPKQEKAQIYDASNIIDLKSSNIKELFEKNELVKSLENEILSNPENITELRINETQDSPLMYGLKTAINSKHCDINSYAPRLDKNYANVIKLLKGTSITVAKAVQIAEATDIAIDVTFRDASPDVPNPIGREIHINLIGGDNKEDYNND